MRGFIWGILAAMFVAVPGAAIERAEEDSDDEAGVVEIVAAPYAQWLIELTARTHSVVKAMEVIAEIDGECRGVATSDKDEIGETRGGEETDVTAEGVVLIEEPEDGSTAYEVTSVLNDARGRPIGRLSIDIEPGDMGEQRVLELAASVRSFVEERIDSKEELFAPEP